MQLFRTGELQQTTVSASQIVIERMQQIPVFKFSPLSLKVVV